MKTFAGQLIEDHRNAQTELLAADEGSGATVPTMLDQEHQARLTALQGKSGMDFDKAYVADQVENHSNALTLYADYMLWGEYEKLHALAMKMIPDHRGATQEGADSRRRLTARSGCAAMFE